MKMSLNQEERWLLSEKHEGAESEAFRADLERLRSGEPLAYVIGHVPFLGCCIHLDSKPLIPRPETEYWVEQAIATISARQTRRNSRVLDLCAGSGCVGVAVAKAVPMARVDLAEIDAGHHATIRKNLEMNGIDGERSRVFGGDLFENVPKTRPKLAEMDELQGAGTTEKEPYALYGEEPSGTRNEEDRHFREFRYDFILTNPPYIDPVLDRAETSVKKFEPRLALYGGKHGLDIINDIINTAAEYLNPGGQLWIEHEPEQSTTIRQSAEAKGFRASTHPDQYGIERFSVLMS